MTEFDNTPQTVRRLVELVADHGLTELVVEADGTVITVRAEREPMAAAPVYFEAPPLAAPRAAVPVVLNAEPTASAAAPASPAAPGSGLPANAVALASPMVGVFYRSPSPDDPPFVLVGDIVKVGQPIGLIEAMKVFSEVPAEVAGRVVETPIESGKLVQQGQPLIFVEPV